MPEMEKTVSIQMVLCELYNIREGLRLMSEMKGPVRSEFIAWLGSHLDEACENLDRIDLVDKCDIAFELRPRTPQHT